MQVLKLKKFLIALLSHTQKIVQKSHNFLYVGEGISESLGNSLSSMRQAIEVIKLSFELIHNNLKVDSTQQALSSKIVYFIWTQHLQTCGMCILQFQCLQHKWGMTNRLITVTKSFQFFAHHLYFQNPTFRNQKVSLLYVSGIAV